MPPSPRPRRSAPPSGCRTASSASSCCTLSGGQRRRVELARILFGDSQTLLLDEPTNHLDADSIVWLREFLRTHKGGLVVISHDVGLLEACVNRVFHLDANRAELDLYNVGWKAYLEQREADERRRRRERTNAEKQAAALRAQADRMRFKATKAKAAQNMDRRAERLVGRTGDHPAFGPRGQAAVPGPGAVRGARRSRRPGCRSPTGRWRSSPTSTSPSTAARGWSCSGSTVPARQRCCASSPGSRRRTPVRSSPGTACGWATTPRSTKPSTPTRTVLENMASAAPDLAEVEHRRILGSFLFSGDDVDKPASVLSGGEKTRLALATLVVSSANVLLLDEPTNNLDPASRQEVLAALHGYRGAVVLVTHDEGAVDALQPERVVLLPDGVEDLWTEDYADLVALA